MVLLALTLIPCFIAAVAAATAYGIRHANGFDPMESDPTEDRAMSSYYVNQD